MGSKNNIFRKQVPKEPLFNELKVLGVKNMYDYLVDLFMYRYHNDIITDVLLAYLLYQN